MELVSLSAAPSNGPLPAASLLWQPRPETWMLTFAWKATFSLQPGQSPLAQTQEPLYEADRHWGDDPNWSVYAPADLVPIRPRADVVLIGEAYAPGGQPVRSLVARLLVGEIDKAIEVFGDRWFTQEGALQEGARFLRMPLLWERAAGGPETQNPVGIREAQRDPYGRRPLPQLQPVGTSVASPADLIEPIGFGPIAPGWPQRRQRLGRYAPPGSLRDWMRAPLPADFDASYFNVAPRDQQVQQLRADERLILDNLHPELPHLVTNLASHTPRAFLRRPREAPQALQLRPDLLWIDTLRGLCTLTWRGQAPVESPEAKGLVIVALEEQGKPLGWPEIEALVAARVPGGRPVHGSEDTGHAGAPPAGAPRSGAAPSSPPRPPVSSITLIPPMSDEDDDEFAIGTSIPALQPVASPSALPFTNTGSSGLPFSHTSATPPTAQGGPKPRFTATPFSGGDPGDKPSGTPFKPAPPSAPSLAAPSPGMPFPSAPPPPAPSSGAASPSRPPTPLPVPPPATPPAFVPAAFVATPQPAPSAPSAPVAPPLVRAPMPRTIGEAALEAPPPLDGASVPGVSTGAQGASDAAAGASKSFGLPRDGARPSAASNAVTPARALAPTPGAPRELLRLLWFDTDSAMRLRRHMPWRTLLRDSERGPGGDDEGAHDLHEDPALIEDRRDVFEILTRATASAPEVEPLRSALEEAEGEDGKFVPPLLLLAGELVFPFDELEVLKTTVAVVTPLIGADENLRATVTNAQEMLKLPELASAPVVAEGLTTRIREAWGKARRPVPEGYLESQTERALLERRSYQRRDVLGKRHLRALLVANGGKELLPTYLPDALATTLPMYARFKARLLGELHLQEDQHEAHPAALRALALARVAPSLRRR
ncbi:DUF2169 family type VI secretion system accessory protein [Chondromyces crocatus]|uniref:DUF2169 domain-containing protein n=1 Tax=Chondromyces crocatus TaxID=52 RepID=A0A0K1EQI3_CHOCO|nr:DUF2169 domain-containing protein [Chondromyces crocatus]AKT42888.1 uncharacterized protein CMC5_071160 [Chondromyces crocatus]